MNCNQNDLVKYFQFEKPRFLDSGCSNHMIGIKSLFKELYETQKIKDQLGNKKEIQVADKGIVEVHTSHDKAKMLDNVQFDPIMNVIF